jgi:hypothetical protein
MTRTEYMLIGRIVCARRGADLPQSRLTVDAVRAIRAIGLAKTARQLAIEYGVHYRTIEKVRSYESWGHV